jgi:hypothetical protein
MSSQVGLVGLLLQAGGMSPFRFGPLGSNLGRLIDYPTAGWLVSLGFDRRAMDCTRVVYGFNPYPGLSSGAVGHSG